MSDRPSTTDGGEVEAGSTTTGPSWSERSREIWRTQESGADTGAVGERHRAEQDVNMTIADGLSRCVCGRTIAEVGTIKDRHWLHVEEEGSGGAVGEREEPPLDVEALSAALRQAYWSKFPHATGADWKSDAEYIIERVAAYRPARLSVNEGGVAPPDSRP